MSTEMKSLTKVIIKRTHRVPQTVHSPNEFKGASETVSRQLDVALISAGFKASSSLLAYVSNLSSIGGREVAREIVEAVKEIKGDHVRHNTYFKEFPNNVPDTLEFWASLIEKTYGSVENAPLFINLLELDGYGSYQHSYEEMVAAHEKFVPNGKEKLTTLNLGGSLEEEVYKLYGELAGSKVPANGDDRDLLKRLAELCVDLAQPEVPVRENKAIINAVRVEFGVPILADTVTDVLRLAVQLSDGDVTLETKPKFKSFPNKTRRLLLDALDRIAQNEAKLGDVYKNRESFKRLFLRLNTNKHYEHAYKVLDFAVNSVNVSFEAKMEKAFANGDVSEVVKVLENNPGLFVRSLNRLLLQSKIKDIPTVTKSLEKVISKVSTPVLVGLRQYLTNRKSQKTYRVFINRKGTGKVVEDTQPVLGTELLNPINELIDQEVANRLPEDTTFVVSRDMLNVALPLSNKQTNDGFGVMPRGSVGNLDAEVLRFFTYWKQKQHTTDYDLSAIMLDENFNQTAQLSYTSLRAVGGVHSGDITSAPNGASEFIDIELDKVQAKYVVPQVNLYGGEKFTEVEESFFGYMERTLDQKGKPFEPLTVKTKAEMRGENRVALPLIFIKEGNQWTVKWLNAFLKGYGWGNRTENNVLSTATMVRSVVETQYLTISYLIELLNRKGNVVYFEDELAGREDFEKLVESKSNTVYVAQDIPEFVNDSDVKAVTLKNLTELLF